MKLNNVSIYVGLFIHMLTSPIRSFINHFKKEKEQNHTPKKVWDNPQTQNITKVTVALHKEAIDILKKKNTFEETKKGNPFNVHFVVKKDQKKNMQETRELWAQNDPIYLSVMNKIFAQNDLSNPFEDPYYLQLIKELFKRTEPWYVELQNIIRPYLAQYNITL